MWNRRKIFFDDPDRDDFLDRLGDILSDRKTPCFAWAFMTNHLHLLLRTGTAPIATVMRRLLTGYAVSFNRRHRRHGHLFQNPYKSILSEEDPYLLELVRYIHLNPLRAKIVRDIKALNKYPYCGHYALMGKAESRLQDVDTILNLFGERSPQALSGVCEEGGCGRTPTRVDGRWVSEKRRRLVRIEGHGQRREPDER
jgi:REP element-mobilizing transposase RayT